jgi:antitoxin ParD1/3/4
MATRNINLTDALGRFVAEKVESGSYQNASEVIRAGLRLLQVEEEVRAERIKRLAAEIQPAIDDIEAGRYIVYENARALFDEVEKRAQGEVKRRRARKK